MLVLSGPQQAANNAAARIKRGMILFDFASGVYGFWEGNGTLTWNSVTFKSGGQLFEVDLGQQTMGLQSNESTIRLRANPDIGLTPNVLSTIFAEQTYGRPVTIYRGLFDPGTRALIGNPIVRRRGYVKGVSQETDQDGPFIQMVAESVNADNTRRGTAKANHTHQQRVSPGDQIYRHVSVAGRYTIGFGSKVPKIVKSGSVRPNT